MIVTANLGADNERYDRQGRQDERLWSPHQSRNDKSYERKRENVHPQLEGATGIDIGCTRALSQSYVDEYGRMRQALRNDQLSERGRSRLSSNSNNSWPLGEGLRVIHPLLICAQTCQNGLCAEEWDQYEGKLDGGKWTAI